MPGVGYINNFKSPLMEYIVKSIKYQVFLSSTYSDLESEREGIIKAILEMYHIPIGMEMFSAEDEDQWEIIRRTIEVSDYYILVLGLRYGSTTSDDISFTQKEYEYALERKIPILAFVMKDHVPLPMDKRDDDLGKVRKFRELVLNNSKMAQFWETKDQLIKNVSVSLMKQIMQKPAIGWIRGDSVAVDEALSKELSLLSRENRELREKIIELESKASAKSPLIEVNLKPPKGGVVCDSFDKIMMPSAINISHVEKHLRNFISAEDIVEYNENLPSEEMLESFNKECEFIHRIRNFSTPVEVSVFNSGSIKANNIYVDILFPDDLFIYEKDQEFKKPLSPIPLNPILIAQSEYIKSLKSISSKISPYGSDFFSLNSLTGANVVSDYSNPLKHFRPLNQQWWTELNERKLTIKINSLLHTRQSVFDDEYMMVPLSPGKKLIEVKVICEEYGEIDMYQLEVDF